MLLDCRSHMTLIQDPRAWSILFRKLNQHEVAKAKSSRDYQGVYKPSIYDPFDAVLNMVFPHVTFNYVPSVCAILNSS